MISRSEYDRLYYEIHKEKVKARSRMWYQTHKKEYSTWRNEYNKTHSRNGASKRYVEKKFGAIHPEKTTCQICGLAISGTKIALDHDPKTMKFRGWLCLKCNRGLGHFGDSIELVKKALDYLIPHDNSTREG